MSNKTTHSAWIHCLIKEEWQGKTVEEILRGPLMISGRMLNRLTRRKGIRLNGRMPYLKQRVKASDLLKVAVRPQEKSPLQGDPMDLHIVYEDLDLLVVEKPPGITVHPVRPTDQKTLCHGISHYFIQQGIAGVPRPVHRLDRYTSGLILIAKNAYMHQLLDRQLRNNQIQREYIALLHVPLEKLKGSIQLPIGRDSHHSTKRQVVQTGDPAITHYEVLQQNQLGSLIRARLETGKTHQIRVHFSFIGSPLHGDTLYGGKTTWIRRQALHAIRLAFFHPLKQEWLEFHAKPPEDFQMAMKHLNLAIPPDTFIIEK